MSRARVKAKSDVTSFGNILIADGICDWDTIERALVYQADHPEVMMGEALVRLGAITRHQLEVALAKQDVARRGAKGVKKLATLATTQAQAVSARIDMLLAENI